MFGLIRQNLQIEKAIVIATTELGINPMGAFGGRTSAAAQQWRQSVRVIIDQLAPNDKELAILIALPFAPLLRGKPQGSFASERVCAWSNLGVIRNDIAATFVLELRAGTFPSGD